MQVPCQVLRTHRHALQVLYNKDCVSDQAIIYWHQKGSKPQGRQHFLKATEGLVKVSYIFDVILVLLLTPRLVFAGAGRQRGRVNRKPGCIFYVSCRCVFTNSSGLGHRTYYYMTAGWVVLALASLYPSTIDKARFYCKRIEIRNKKYFTVKKEARSPSVPRGMCAYRMGTLIIESYHTSRPPLRPATLISHHVQPRSRGKMTRSSPSPRRIYKSQSLLQSQQHTLTDSTHCPTLNESKKKKDRYFIFRIKEREKRGSKRNTKRFFLGAYDNLLERNGNAL
jgi:hypothetical protein